MTIGTALYNLLIGPLELFFEVVFSIAYRILNHPGLSIIFLSLAMNFLVLPLYRRADALQAEQRNVEAKLQPWVTHIKKTFKGDERFMMLQTYYRQNHYKPTYALKGSISLLLEIPFFIAAYRFLSGLQLLRGVSFGPIRDLGAPDALLTVAGLTINVLPILMTAINVVSAAIYMKGFPFKSKLQMYGMALIFLVFLYNSPAGLVFYWTLNNVFSLLKNIFYKLRNPRLVLSVSASVVGLALLAVVLFVHPMDTMRKQILLILLLLMLQLPLVLTLVKKGAKKREAPTLAKADGKIFAFGCVFLTILTGVLIPSAVIKASPAEFVDIMAYKSPLWYVLNSLLLAGGTFLIWFGIFYKLASPAGKKAMGFVMLALSGVSIVDYMFFGTNFGNLSSMLKYDVYPTITSGQMLVNLAILLVLVALLYLIWKKKAAIVQAAYLALCLAVVGMSVVNVAGIRTNLSEMKDNLETTAQDMPKIPLSKHGKNVVVLMMDRAVNGFVPFLLEEKPELQAQFAGFTYYPNTISFGVCTNEGAPAIYGGYEYTPEAVNQRVNESLESKNNEALKVMPVLFDENDFEVTVCDPTYAGYQWIPDLSIYDEYPDIHKYITMGKFQHETAEEKHASAKSAEAVEHARSRNFFCYSLFKISPLFCQPSLYNQGLYNEADAMAEQKETTYAAAQSRSGVSKASGMDTGFLNAYAVLENLTAMTEIQDSAENTFLMMSNDTTHDAMLLQEPEYEPAAVVDNTEYDAAHTERRSIDGRSIQLTDEYTMIHYHANMASLIQIGNWLDYLRANDVYDNTRIIIVADHACPLPEFEKMAFGSNVKEGMTFFNPLLLVKDFNSTTFTTDGQFMTNGDVPTLALQGLVENPFNPFTGKAINSDAKNAPEQHVSYTNTHDVTVDNGNTHLPSEWYAVHDNIFDANNWRSLGTY